MILTGKCKKDFERWYVKVYYPNHRKISQRLQILVFTSLEFPKQYGVYVDFFDSVGFYITGELSEVWVSEIKGIRYSWYVYDLTNTHEDNSLLGLLTRNEARTEAILKANEIYNK